MRFLTLFFFTIARLTASEPIQLASEARLWLRVPAGEPPLTNVRVSAGSANQASWEKDAAARERLTDVNFPIQWWRWSNVAINFTASQDQSVEIVLGGQWSQGPDGKPYRREILWDGFSAEATEIANGNFENQSPTGPASWKSLWGPYLTADAWPLVGAQAFDGKFVAASWLNRPLSQTIQVKGGRPVTLHLHAKAATIPGFVAPKIFGKNTPAHRAVASIKRGVNLGNCWEAPPPYTWGVRYTPADIDQIATEGFDHIRVPVAWQFYLKEGTNGLEIAPSLIADLEPVLRRAIDKKMHVLLDWHHFDKLTDDPAANRELFVRGWEAIARHFKSWPQALFFELLNEPRDALTTEVANPIYAEAIAAIRKICPDRIIFVSPGKWGNIHELDQLRLPDHDDKLVVTVHCYDPFYFTHQEAGWVHFESLTGITYPGPPARPVVVPAALEGNVGVKNFIHDYNTLPADRNPCSANQIAAMLDLAHDWSEHFGRPVHLGEFGSHNTIDPASRARYSHDVRTLAEARGIPWTLWDWKATFGYWNPKTDKASFSRDAFFGK